MTAYSAAASGIAFSEDEGVFVVLAVESVSYDEYAMRRAMAGVEPTASPSAFRPNRDAKDNSQ